ncbi:hypothetical protein [Ohtaekwangia koreensis]|nr:hypothetical protein [Ohtaekwangia koreensis]
MRKITAIVFLFLYLSANTELKQIFKLPVFVAHYLEHRQNDRNIGLVDFIVLHYFSGDIKDADFNRDQQLPFKRICCTVYIFLALPADNSAVLHHILFQEETVSFTFSPQFTSSSFHLLIWQPPKA